VIGLYKTELIARHQPWRTREEVEAQTLHYVHWFNHDRLMEVNGDIPPIELENAYYARQTTGLAEAG
jgi:putative transposase